WLFAGTSQAAAVVSGVVAHLLSIGVDPDEVGRLMQQTARTKGLLSEPFVGVGAGGVDLYAAELEHWFGGGAEPEREFAAGILPYLLRDGDDIRPAARVWVVESGRPAAGHLVVGSLMGQDRPRIVHCTTDDLGSCDLYGPSQADEGDGMFAFSVDSVMTSGVGYRPTAALFATDGLEIVLQALAADDGLDAPLLGFRLSEGQDEALGAVADSLLMVNTGTGMLSMPLGLVVQTDAYPWYARTHSVDLAGSGMLTAPLGVVDAMVFPLPLGEVVAFDPFDLAAGGLDFHPTDVFGPDSTAGSGMLTAPLGFQGELVDLGRQWSSASLGGTILGSALQGSGLVTPAGDDVACHLIGSGAMGLSMATTGTAETGQPYPTP
ncbi:MAG: hypothetical protein AAF211_22750, partial [Myxococcota bacterium]